MKYLYIGFIVASLFPLTTTSADNLKSDIATVKEALSIIAPAYGWQLSWTADQDVKTGEVTIRQNMNFVSFVFETLRSVDHPYYAVICEKHKILVITDEPPPQISQSCILFSTVHDYI